MNGRNLVGVTHHESVDVLKEAGNNITMAISRLTTKPKLRPATSQQPTRISSTSSADRHRHSLSDDAVSPRPTSTDVKSGRQGPPTSPARLTLPSANQSHSPALLTPARLSGTAAVNYEVGDFSAVLIVDTIFPFSALTLLVGRQKGHPACKKTRMLVCWW